MSLSTNTHDLGGSQNVDEFGRYELSQPIKQAIADSFSMVPPGKRGAMLLVADKGSDTVRLHLAANVGDTWKVAAGVGWEWGKKSPDTAFVSVAGVW